METVNPLGAPDGVPMSSWTAFNMYPPAFVPVTSVWATHESLAIAPLPVGV
jgi:hypothetical protein